MPPLAAFDLRCVIAVRHDAVSLQLLGSIVAPSNNTSSSSEDLLVAAGTASVFANLEDSPEKTLHFSNAQEANGMAEEVGEKLG